LADRKGFVLNASKSFRISQLSVSKVEVLEGLMEGSMEEKRLVITCTLTVNGLEIPTHALTDCGATGIALMDQDFACHHHILRQELKERKQIEVIDGRSIVAGDIRHIANGGMKLQDHGEQLPMCITKLEQYPIVFRISRL
jgi:hypothetical protein